MAGKVVSFRPVSSFDFELVEGESGDSSTVPSLPNQPTPWIDPATIKLRHRIGRGPFGDVWLATHHRVSEEYEEYHEVAVKMLHPVKEDNVRDVLNRLDAVLFKCQGLETVCWLHGISVINTRVCIVMKFYEGSVGDKMARFKGGKLTLSDVLRYGANLAQGIMDLHAKSILILNLKPFNFLLNSNDQVIVGDVGIPYVLLGISLPNADMARRLGTPSYMAPEQWQPEVRSPISVETDSWGFGCSVLEMLTGKQPWSGKSIEEIYKLVVTKREKPHVPGGLGLPPAVENVIAGCFEYDLRSRPLMADILHAFKCSEKAVYEVGLTDLGSRMIREKEKKPGYTEWFLKKDQLQVGDVVRSRKSANSCNPRNMDVPEGTIVGLERDTDEHGFVLVRVPGVHDPIRVHFSTLERVTFGLAAGDWVRLKKEDKKHSPVGVLHSIDRAGNVEVAFIGLETLWKGNCSEFQMAKPYCVGEFVRVKSSVFSPRFEWLRKRGGEWATGRIGQVLSNGCLVVDFPGRLTIGQEFTRFLGDPAEVELVSFETCEGVVKKYQHLEDFHWSVRPILIAMGLFVAMKIGFFVGKKKTGKGKSKEKGSVNVQSDEKIAEGKSGAWRPPKVTEIFR